MKIKANLTYLSKIQHESLQGMKISKSGLYENA